MAPEPTATEPEVEPAESLELEAQIASAEISEEDAAAAVAAAEKAGADAAELKALREEKAQWAADRAALEKKAARVVPAPPKKADKTPTTPDTEPVKKARSGVSTRWFGAAANGE